MMRSRWVSFLFLLPLVSLLCLHKALGLSEALNVPVAMVGGREQVGFVNCYVVNWLIVLCFFTGVPAFFLHALFTAEPTTKGMLFLLGKFVFVAVFWTVFTSMGHSR